MLIRFCKFFLSVILLLSPLPLLAAPFAGMVVFGDSLSDNGNLAALPDYSFLNQAPYQHGFTNDLTAVAHLATIMNLPLTPSLHLFGTVNGNNFAVAGARAGKNGAIDLTAQVTAFLTSQSGKASADNLYILFIGGNDIRDMRDQPDETLATAILNNAAANIRNTLTQLINAGAKRFLVVNSPNIGAIPETQALAKAAGNNAIILRANQKTIAFNKKLTETVASVEKAKAVDIVSFNLYNFFSGIIQNSNAYLFNNVKQGCYSSDNLSYFAPCSSNLMDSYVFFDERHPGKRVHVRLGRALYAVVPEAL